MPERFPKLDESQFDDAQKMVRPGVAQINSRFPYLPSQTPDGKLYGPFNQLCYTPSLVQSWFAHGMMTTRLPELSDRERELCILATLSVIDSPYPRFAHKIIAGEVGLVPGAIQAAMEGECHSTLSKTETAVYRLARVLAESRGPIADHDFEAALAHFDRKKILAVVHMVISYIYVSLLTNIGDCEVPAESGAGTKVQE